VCIISCPIIDLEESSKAFCNDSAPRITDAWVHPLITKPLELYWSRVKSICDYLRSHGTLSSLVRPINIVSNY
jgi:hypothetical protein